jgi:hypothetical protein
MFRDEIVKNKYIKRMIKKQIVIKRIRTKSVIKIKWKWIPRGVIENKKTYQSRKMIQNKTNSNLKNND